MDSLRKILLLLTVLLTGCTSVQVAHLGKRLHEPFRISPVAELRISPRTEQTLRTYDIEKKLAVDLAPTIASARRALTQEPTLDLNFAVAELAFLEGNRLQVSSRERALEMYLLSAQHAYAYLFDPQFQRRRSGFDPHFREACQFYNRSFEKVLRLLGTVKSVDLHHGQVYSLAVDGTEYPIGCQHLTGLWGTEPMEPFRFASDVTVKELKSEYRQYGLGVPLLARRQEGSRGHKTTKYTPDRLCFPVTAVLRFVPPQTPIGKYQVNAVIELYDPLATLGTTIAGQQVPLESDLTTPIAYSLSDPHVTKMSTLGLLRSDLLLKPFSELTGKKAAEKSNDPDDEAAGTDEFSDDDWSRKTVKGLYLTQPFEQGKIPIIFIHGVWSSPMTWLEMFNTLRSEPAIRDRFQFFFYFYPTGQPFWVSAAQLRDDLAEFRATFDPQRTDPAFDDMVLVGHSMGGLLSHLQTIDSGNAFWKLVSNESPETVLTGKSDDVKAEAMKWFFFQANPSIRRVITIATPFQGSKASNNVTQWFGKTVIKLPENVRSVVAPNELLTKQSLLKVQTSIDSLSADHPIFDVMRQKRQESTVHYHNILGELDAPDWWKRSVAAGDGVVTTTSARLEHCDSEITVPSEHTTIHAHPRTIQEVRRILFEHLRATR